MKKRLISNFVVCALIFILFTVFYSFAQERITLTTYYPAPYGVYREMRVDRMSVGPGYRTVSLNDGELLVNGTIGIGTIQPLEQLHVLSTSASDGGAVFSLNDDLYSSAWGRWVKVGTPELATYGVLGTEMWYGSDYAFFGLRGTIENSQDALIQWGDDGSEKLIFAYGLRTAPTQVMGISGGNVGIGTTVPSAKLDIRDEDDSVSIGTQVASGWTNANGIIGFPGYGMNHGQIAYYPSTGSGGSFGFIESSAGDPGGDYGPLTSSLSFSDIWANQGRFEGQVGIGTTNPPASTLDVRGSSNTCVRISYTSGSGNRQCPGDYRIALGTAVSALNMTNLPTSGYFVCCRQCDDSSNRDGVCD